MPLIPTPNTAPAPAVQVANISQFSFDRANNPSLTSNMDLQIENELISGRISENVAIDNLVASFTHSKGIVSVNSAPQTSGQSSNDFTQIQTFTVTTSDGTSKTYSVDVTQFTGLPVYISTEGGANIVSKDDHNSIQFS